MIDLISLLENRYSVRSFTDAKVEEEKRNAILRAGQVAPTAKNNQPQKILCLQSRESLEKWSRCTPCHFNEQLVLLVCCDRELSWKRACDGKDSGDVDAAIVTTHMQLEAWNRGIGSTWIMNFDPEAVHREFGLPERLEPISALAMGYASEAGAASPRHALRKDLKETVWFEGPPEKTE